MWGLLFGYALGQSDERRRYANENAPKRLGGQRRYRDTEGFFPIPIPKYRRVRSVRVAVEPKQKYRRFV